MGVSIGKSPINSLFSIAMFDYRRVSTRPALGIAAGASVDKNKKLCTSLCAAITAEFAARGQGRLAFGIGPQNGYSYV
jgi:hypothetical protein